MEIKRKWYLMRGKVLDSFNAWAEERKAKKKEWAAWGMKYGGDTTVIAQQGWTERRVVGLPTGDNKPCPPHFRLVRGKGRSPDYYSPVRKTKEGKAIAKEMNALRHREWHCEGFEPTFQGMYLCEVSYEKIGAEMVLGIPDNSTFVPPECIEVPRSKVELMRESIAQKKA